jgi:hypothetical protein
MRQPEAIALYASAGYMDAEPFGHYAGAPLARHLAKDLRVVHLLEPEGG